MNRIAYLGMGGNLGNVRAAFTRALNRFADHQRCSGIRVSRLYRTDPWGITDQPDFLNIAVELDWSGEWKELAALAFELERNMGRVRETAPKWGPRVLDIDLLLFTDLEISEGDVQIPHPRIVDRKFVLRPLFDLAPELVLPGWDITVSEALQRCPDISRVTPVSESAWMDWRLTTV